MPISSRIIQLPVALLIILVFYLSLHSNLIKNHRHQKTKPKNERIVNGHDSHHCHAYVDILTSDGSASCGGIIYKNNFGEYGIVTANHCNQNSLPKPVRIYPNSCDRSKSIMCQVTEWHHIKVPVTDYRGNDIAVAGFTNCESVLPDFDKLSIPNLPNPHDPKMNEMISSIKGKQVTAIGRGDVDFEEEVYIYDYHEVPKTVQEATFKVTDNIVGSGILSIQASDATLCYGDSGSGVFDIDETGKSILVGTAGV